MKRFLMILILAAAAAFGMYAAYRYYQDEYLPEQVKKQDIKNTQLLFEQVHPDSEFPAPADMPTHDTENETVPVSAALPETTVSAPEDTQVFEIPDTSDKSDILTVYDDSPVYAGLPECFPVSENPLEKGQGFNSDMIGWIFIPDTDIDYPIVQCEDNDFYLNHGLDKQYNQLGVPFMDYQCNSDFSGFNSIVYAHNMEWVLLFAEIYQFKTPAFLKSHSYGWLTVGDEIHRVDFFAYMTVRDGSDAYETIFITDDNKKDYLEYLRTHAIHRYNPPPEEELLESHLLLLSTCTFEYEGARGILTGVIR